jgi:hypothetical protein
VSRKIAQGNTFFVRRKLETAKKIIGSLEKFKMDNLKKKKKISGFDQPLFRANLTADQIWLTGPSVNTHIRKYMTKACKNSQTKLKNQSEFACGRYP